MLTSQLSHLGSYYAIRDSLNIIKIKPYINQPDAMANLPVMGAGGYGWWRLCAMVIMSDGDYG